VTVGAIVSSIARIQKTTDELFRSFGTDQGKVSQFSYTMADLSLKTNMLDSEFVDLASTMRDAGVPIQANNKAWQDLMVVAGRGSKVLGLTNETTAELVKNMTASGAGAREVQGAMDSLYAITQFTNRSIKEINASLAEGQTLFKEYGGSTHESMQGMSAEVLKIHSLMSAVNVDTKTADSFMAKMLENPRLRARHAAVVGAALGIPQDVAFGDMATKKGLSNELQSGMRMGAQFLGTDRDKMGLTKDEIVGKFGYGGYESFTNRQNATLDQLQGQGFDRKMMSQGMSDFAAFIQQQIPDMTKRMQLSGDELTKLTESWIKIREEQQSANAPKATTIDTAYKNLQAQLPALFKQFEILGQVLADILVLPLIPALTNGIKVFNEFLSGFIGIVPAVWNWFTQMFQPFTAILDSIGKSLGQMFDEIVTAFQPLQPALDQLWVAFGNLANSIGALIGRALLLIVPLAGATLSLLTAFDGFLKSITGGKGFVDLLNDAVSFTAKVVNEFADGLNKFVDWLNKTFHLGLGIDSRVAAKPQAQAQTPQGMFNSLFGSPATPSASMVAPLAEAVKQGVTQAQVAMSGASAIAAPLTQAVKTGITQAQAAMSGAASSAGKGFGWLSQKYEAGRPGTIGDGTLDKKGRRHWAYGNFQMDHLAKTPDHFVESIKTSAPDIYNRLAPLLGSTGMGKKGAFGQEWQSIAGADPKRFTALQTNFIKHNYLDPFIKQYGAALNSPAVREEVLSSSVHFGVGGAGALFKKAGLGHVDDKTFLEHLYAEKERATGGKFHNRYQRENQDVMTALLEEQNNLLKQTLDVHKKDSEKRSDMHQDLKQTAAMNDPTVQLHQRLMYSGTI